MYVCMDILTYFKFAKASLRPDGQKWTHARHFDINYTFFSSAATWTKSSWVRTQNMVPETRIHSLCASQYWIEIQSKRFMQKYFDWKKKPQNRRQRSNRTKRYGTGLSVCRIFCVKTWIFSCFSIVCNGLRGEHNFLIFPLTFDMFHVQEGIWAASQWVRSDGGRMLVFLWMESLTKAKGISMEKTRSA